MEIKDFLELEFINYGLTPEYVGYNYLLSAVAYTIEDRSLLCSITTKLYPLVAEENQVSSHRVERGIRTLIAVFWNDSTPSMRRELFGFRCSTCPGNAKFIGVLSRRLQIKANAMNRENLGNTAFTDEIS